MVSQLMHKMGHVIGMVSQLMREMDHVISTIFDVSIIVLQLMHVH